MGENEMKCFGLLFVICGLFVMIGAVAAEIAWLGLCFGTVIIGIVMLFLAPHVLFAPFMIGIGMTLWESGLAMISDE